MPPTALLVAGAAILSGVASLIVAHAEAWPEDVPSRSYYDRIWESDLRLQRAQSREQYRAAVLRFYSGTAREPGWHRRRAEMISLLGPLRTADLDLVGRILSSEIARPESIRRIPPSTLAFWEKTLRGTRDAGTAAALLDRIGDEVRGLIDPEPTPAATGDRYVTLALVKGICR
jgi:hypothetical protein